jgi:hypothetical protein
MRHCILLASLIGLAAAAPAQPAAASSLAPTVKKDVQCFLLYAAAAGDTKDEKVRQAGGFGTMYYLGKLDVAAPGLNIVEAVRAEAKALEGNPTAKEIGTSCDSEFGKRGAELMKIGEELQETKP